MYAIPQPSAEERSKMAPLASPLQNAEHLSAPVVVAHGQRKNVRVVAATSTHSDECHQYVFARKGSQVTGLPPGRAKCPHSTAYDAVGIVGGSTEAETRDPVAKAPWKWQRVRAVGNFTGHHNGDSQYVTAQLSASNSGVPPGRNESAFAPANRGAEGWH
jgi:hypothetical protein